jgi:hypothetical protein
MHSALQNLEHSTSLLARTRDFPNPHDDNQPDCQPYTVLRYARLFIFLNSSVPSLLPLRGDDAQCSQHWKTLRIGFLI